MRLPDRILVTGSSGFVGYHVLASLEALGYPREGLRCVDLVEPSFATPYPTTVADIRDLDAMRNVAAEFKPEVIVHLAAEAEVITPWRRLGDLIGTNHQGTYNLFEAFAPRVLIFPSTCAVYGNASRKRAVPLWSRVAPLSLYGMSKATGELICRDWTRQSGNSAVILRFANLIGRRCRGLIAYLARHIQQYPDGSTKAQMRGHGRLVRDYVPIDFAVRIVLAATSSMWKPGVHTYNVSVGRGTNNAEVADIVRRAIEPHGYRLNVNWVGPAALGEARQIVLEPDATTRRFEIKPPDQPCVEACIEDSILHHLGVVGVR